MTPLRPLLASLALLAGGCVLLVDDPDGWTVSPGTSPDPAGASGASGSSSDGAGPGLHCYADANSCRCEPTEPGDDDDGAGPACGGDAHPDWLCCGDIQYAATSTRCECQALSCKLTSGGCECYLGIAHGPDRTCTPRDETETCCRSFGSCRCGPGVSCDPSDVVPTCEATRLRCDDQRFAFCSPLPG